jgi:predicted PurR-regulated permease PerM
MGLAVVLLLAWAVFHYFLLTFTVAVSLALLLQPLQRSLVRRLGGRRWLAAAVLVVLCTVVLLVPVFTYGTLLGQQALAFFEWLRPRLQPHELEKLWVITLPDKYPVLMAWVRSVLGGGSAMALFSNSLSGLAASANHWLAVGLTNLAAALLDVIILLMMLFFLLRDGESLREGLRGISPLTRGQETEMLDHLTNTVRGVLQSMLIVPLVQGVLAAIGFWAFGVPSPLLWGVMVVFAALIPILGSPLAWVPVGVYLMVTGAVGRGVGVIVYGVLVISMVDNILKPLILRGTAQIHTMLGFLSILGGLMAFGPKGIIVGPVVLSLVLSAYRIYRYDILRWREGAQAAAPEEVPAAIAR